MPEKHTTGAFFLCNQKCDEAWGAEARSGAIPDALWHQRVLDEQLALYGRALGPIELLNALGDVNHPLAKLAIMVYVKPASNPVSCATLWLTADRTNTILVFQHRLKLSDGYSKLFLKVLSLILQRVFRSMHPQIFVAPFSRREIKPCLYPLEIIWPNGSAFVLRN